MTAFNTLVAALTIDQSSYFALAGTILTAIMAVWVVRKVIKLGNKS